MCGIAGVYSPQRGIRADCLRRMSHAIRHRGPNDEGFTLIDTHRAQVQSTQGAESMPGLSLPFLADEHVLGIDLALVNRRLAILDLSVAGHMPMNWQGGTWMTYNGEVYNYCELRDELASCGYRFQTQTDTEVILAAYDRWGEDCLNHFNGMFAFALWDARRRRLFCARDRMGVKPLYYAWHNGQFVFASEIKAILASGLVVHRPNDLSIYHYLTWNDLDFDDSTFFDGIAALPPAHYLILENGQLQTPVRWWDVSVETGFSASKADLPQRAEELRALLADAVRLRLRSDVAVATSLSGGLDSTSIVCLINRQLQQGGVSQAAISGRQKTYTASYADLRFDERSYVNQVVGELDLEHHEVFPQSADLLKDLPSFLWHQDGPVASASMYAQWVIMRAMHQSGITVSLDGQGSDEILGGYYPYISTFLAECLRRGRVGQFWTESRLFAQQMQRSQRDDILRAFFYAYMPAGLQMSLRRRRDLAAFAALSPEFRSSFSGQPWPSQAVLTARTLAGRQHQDAFRFILPYLLRNEDRSSMAFSIEARLPFLDYRLIEFAFGLPEDYRVGGGWTKRTLRAAMQGILPEPVRLRADKMGFITPEARWLADISPHLQQLLSNSSLQQYLDVGQVMAQWQHLPELQHKHTRTLVWRWINVAMWLKVFFDRSVEELADPPERFGG